MAFGEINRLKLIKSAACVAVNQHVKKLIELTQLFIESPNQSSFKKWQIIQRAVEPGFSITPNGHVWE